MAMASHANWQSGKTLSQSASFMLDNEIATDVTFTFPNNNQTIKAHRFVLMARSHVFYVMFDTKWDKPREDIEISDIAPDIFREFLKYLYCDEITISADKALHLPYCAEKYEVTDLKAKCTEFLQTQVNETTVAMVLDHAVLYNEEVLISTCRDIIEPLETLSCLEEHHVTKDTMELVLGFEGLSVGEVDIFKFCNTWAENECKRMEIPVNASNRRKMLGPLLKWIPFCSMTQEEFATEVSGKHLLNHQEELQIFGYICAPGKSNPPFPCKAKKETKKPPFPHEAKKETKKPLFQWKTKKETKKPYISVKLPKMSPHLYAGWGSGPRSGYKLILRCDTSYTLLGLGFTKAGNYDVTFDDTHNEKFNIQEGNLQGFLKTPHEVVEQWLHIEGNHQGIVTIGAQFSHVEQVAGQKRPVQLEFSMDWSGEVPFDTLLLQLQS